jgi:hypothetical protein
MKVRSCFASQIWEMGGSLFFQRLLIALLIAVLTFGSLPVQRTFAAPSDTSDSALNTLLESAWSRKLRKVRAFRSFYNRVRVYPADFKDPDELARAHDLLNRYGTALRGAQRIIANQTAFNVRGRIIDPEQAYETLRDLGGYLHAMRRIKMKLDLIGHYRLLPAGTTQ